MSTSAPKIKFRKLTKKPVKKDSPFFAPIKSVKPKLKKVAEKKSPPKKTALRRKSKKSISDKDPKLRRLKINIDDATAKNSKHQSAEKKVSDTQKAVDIGSQVDKSSKAKASQVGEMAQQKPKKFDGEKFSNDILTNIKKVIPASEAEMENDGTSSEKMADAQQTMTTTLDNEKQKSGGDISQTASSPPNTDSVIVAEVSPLSFETPQQKPKIEHSAISPDLKKPSETSLAKDSDRIDQKMKDSKITDQQLKKSNEPAFQSAVEEKSKSQENAKKTHSQYLQKAIPVTKNAESFTKSATAAGIEKSTLARKQNISATEKKQLQQKAKEEQVRKKIAADLEQIYVTTKTKVETRLERLSNTVNSTFDTALQNANTVFENNVRERTETSFLDDLISWASGIPHEVENVFKEEQDKFINSLKPVVQAIGKLVEKELLAATDDIETGKQQVQKYWDSLGKEAQKIGADLHASVENQFNELENTVEQAGENLKDSITTKFNDAVSKLEETFEKIKEENKSWLEKAFDAVVGTIKAILEMKDMLLSVLRKAANVIEGIISDPIGFIGNLIKAVKMGFSNFASRALQHLKEGFITWLMGNMPPSVKFPEKWDLKGILQFVMSVLGLTWENIRGRAVKMYGPTVVTALETGFEIFMIVKNEGLGGLWKFIQEKIGDLKVMVLEAIQNMLVEKVLKAGATWVMSLFNPAGAFIKACIMIYDVVMWFINNAKRILDLVNSILDSVSLIIAGSLEQAANFVENSLKKAIPVVIGFLASLLGIGDLSKKVQALIDKIQAPINKAIDWVLEKAGAFAKKLAKAGVAGFRKILEWLGIIKPFKLGEERHTLQFRAKGDQAEFIVKSTPTRYKDFIKNVNFKKPEKKKEAGDLGNDVDHRLSLYNGLKDDEAKKKWSDELIVPVNKIANIIENFGEITSDDETKVPSIVTYGGVNAKGLATTMEAKQLTINNTEGQETGEGGDRGTLTSDFEEIKKNKSARWIRGHLLNAKLGGLVNNTNLTPLTSTTNREHLMTVEKAAKKIVTGQKSASDKKEKKGIIYYKVNVVYGDHPTRGIQNSKKSQRHKNVAIAEEQKGVVPTALQVYLKKLKLSDKKVVDDPAFAPVNETVKNSLTPNVDL